MSSKTEEGKQKLVNEIKDLTINYESIKRKGILLMKLLQQVEAGEKLINLNKYFHPDECTEVYDWDKMAERIRVISDVRKYIKSEILNKNNELNCFFSNGLNKICIKPGRNFYDDKKFEIVSIDNIEDDFAKEDYKRLQDEYIKKEIEMQQLKDMEEEKEKVRKDMKIKEILKRNVFSDEVSHDS
jgi:hypothetical protein